jgi:dCTP deaminase
MAFSDVDIKKLLKKRIIGITPLTQDQIGPASVDLTLSDIWYFPKKELTKTVVDLSKLPWDKAMQQEKRKTVTLRPGEMVLGKTVERITLPPNIMGKLEGRSRYARMGLIIHLTAAIVQPGVNNRQVLEIVNMAPFPVKIHSGMRISQIIFHALNSNSSKPYARYGKIARKQ